MTDRKCTLNVCSHQCERYESCKNVWDSQCHVKPIEYNKIHTVVVFLDKDKEPVFTQTYVLGDKVAENRITDVMSKLKKFYGNSAITKIDMEVAKIEKVDP